jgi:hypothetical protein
MGVFCSWMVGTTGVFGIFRLPDGVTDGATEPPNTESSGLGCLICSAE